jgi:hypothetical protein
MRLSVLKRNRKASRHRGYRLASFLRFDYEYELSPTLLKQIDKLRSNTLLRQLYRFGQIALAAQR